MAPKLADYSIALLRVMHKHHVANPGAQISSRVVARELGDVQKDRVDEAVRWLEKRGVVKTVGRGPDTGRIVQLTAEGVGWVEENAEDEGGVAVEKEEPVSGKPSTKQNPRDVFIVHGRNIKAFEAMRDFLRTLDLNPIDFDTLSAELGGTPFVGDIVREGLKRAQAMIVIFTPDERADLRKDFVSEDDKPEDRGGWQSRPNVLFEAGMAMGIDEKRTILVTMGPDVRLFSDAGGRRFLRMDGSQHKRDDLRKRLEGAQCAVKASKDWLTTGDFPAAIALAKPDPMPSSAVTGTVTSKAGDTTKREEPKLRLKVEHPRTHTSPETHEYKLTATVTNTTDRRIDDWEVTMEIPTAFLTSTSYGPVKVESESNETKTLFAWNQEKVAEKSIRAGSTRSFYIAYVVTTALYDRRDELFGLPVKVTASVDGEVVDKFNAPIEDLQEF